MELEIDDNAAKTPISVREKIAVWALLIIFQIMLPAKYSHQVTKISEHIKDLLSQ